MKGEKVVAAVFGVIIAAFAVLIVWTVMADNNGDDGQYDGYIGNYATYNTSSFLYSGTFKIEITDVNNDTGEFKYTTTWSFRSAFLGIFENGSSEQWTPSSEDRINNPFASADTVELKGTETIFTKDGRKQTNVLLLTLPEMIVTVWIGDDNNILYRMEMPMEGIGTVTWNLNSMNIS